MDSATYIAFAAGAAVGLLILAIVLGGALRRTRARYEARLAHYEDEVAELRQERADDRETNRRLRRELALNTPGTLQATRAERDRAIEELDKLHTELRQATSELAARDRSLREARLAIHDIRVQLERNRFELGEAAADGAGPVGDRGDQPAGSEAALAVAAAADDSFDQAADLDHDGEVGEPGHYAAVVSQPEHQGTDGVDHDELAPAGSDADSEAPGGPRFFADYPLGGAATS